MMLDIGIDLGTTNSAIAVQDGMTTVLLDGEGGVLVPSAVHLRADGTVTVGSAARSALLHDPRNVAIEFKRLMGTAEKRSFPAQSVEFGPEQLSAEVIRALLERAEAHIGNRPRAAVITVPAMFHLPQCDATRRAAALAGVEHAPLLQEPIAAAIAHSAASDAGGSRDGYWLVYDLGGGTFDVSLVRSKAGRLQILDHDGDNHLGGRDLDRVVARQAMERANASKLLGDINRSDPRYSVLQMRMKAEAERVRIALSKEAVVRFVVGDVDGSGSVLDFEFTRDALHALLRSTLQRTTALCKVVLARNQIVPGELRGIVLVGGPTLTPSVGSLIRGEVGVDALHHVDPLTIVARGAALFASTQRSPFVVDVRPGRAPVELEFEAMTTDPTPLVVGKAPAASRGTARARRGDGGLDTGPQPVDSLGRFALDLELVKGAMNSFSLELADAQGRPIRADPDEIRILHGFSVASPPLSQSVGIMLADNTVSWYITKGAVLPARGKRVHVTVTPLKRGQSSDAVHVPLVQGESEKGDRNKVIGVLKIVASNIGRDVPAGSEIEVTIEIDRSSQTRGRAYVPLLDQWFDNVAFLDMETKQPDEVRKNLGAQKERLANLEAMADELAEDAAVSDERLADIEDLLEEGDRDSVDVADVLVRTMAERLDKAEDGGRRARIEKDLALQIEEARLFCVQAKLPDQARIAEAMYEEATAALAKKDLEEAEAKTRGLKLLADQVYACLPGFWIDMLELLTMECQRLGVSELARPHREAGLVAVQRKEWMALERACRAILNLLPREQRASLPLTGIRSDVE